MKYLLSLALLLASLSIQAEIYRWTDEEGNVHFSDEEHPDAELIPTPTPNTVPMPKLEPKKSIVEEKKESSYKSFGIVSPVNNATIKKNTGNIIINLSVKPALNTKKGHRIAIYLDGKTAIAATTKLKIALPNISRGKHTLHAKIKDKAGKPIINSNSVTIHMKRLSSQSGTASGPRDSEGNPYTPGPQGTTFKPGPIIPPSNP